MNKAWIGVDLDGTLAHYEGWKGELHIGKPIPAMIERVKQWLAEGMDVRIVTARFDNGKTQIDIIMSWCQKHIGVALPVTNKKDFGMIELWDDRCVRVISNTGRKCCEN